MLAPGGPAAKVLARAISTLHSSRPLQVKAMWKQSRVTNDPLT